MKIILYRNNFLKVYRYKFSFLILIEIIKLLNIIENNEGTIGHVAHGKSTVVKAISGVQTVRFKNELERNITIKLGYANAKV